VGAATDRSPNAARRLDGTAVEGGELDEIENED
jgi:hypothetical protein